MLWILLIVVVLGALAIVGCSRISPVRKPGVEGMEDSAAVESYSQLTWSPRQRIIQSPIVKELKKHNPRGTVVNAGCGPGYLEAALLQRLPELNVIATDIDPAMVKVAKRNISSRPRGDTVSFQVSDVHDLPFGDSTVDIVVSAMSLHHWRDSRRALGEIHRALRPGGQFVLFDLRRDSRRWFYWLLKFLEITVVSEPLRSIDAPTESIRASYTPAEVRAMLSAEHWKQWRVKAGSGWMLVWGCKREP